MINKNLREAINKIIAECERSEKENTWLNPSWILQTIQPAFEEEQNQFQVDDKVMIRRTRYNHDWENKSHIPIRDSDGNIMFYYEPGIIHEEAYLVETFLPKDSDPCCSKIQCFLDKDRLSRPTEEELRDWDEIVEKNT